ncbi:hypothetical protein [Paractinoplanes brasiliensis]|uniref:Uncharacterized protein n=1 Tax=Paractinoplanes brasiliensis TaxID=52695 RepID=A0A4V3C686_9ACTN|nr:hypothetical protein [Actinoplanes brasiliensis]TDO32758.1 hypothetical protein C8E87_8230 [Actinoplanes brasiliensis]GID31699.1 hypothetical protein Abr02nite_66820 [Actinoplanes brasiliensis]
MLTASYANHRLDLIPGAGFQASPAGASRPAASAHRSPVVAVAAPLGREPQIALVLQALSRGHVVNVRGPCGIGKSTLLRHLASADAALPAPGASPGRHAAGNPVFPDHPRLPDGRAPADPAVPGDWWAPADSAVPGDWWAPADPAVPGDWRASADSAVSGAWWAPADPAVPGDWRASADPAVPARPWVYVHVSAGDEPEDVVEAVLGLLGHPGRPEALAHLRPVVALDCDAGGVAAVEALRPHCAVLVGSEQHVTGVPCELPGLAEEDAVVLLARDLGRDLDASERMAAARLTAAIEGSPLRLRQAAAVVREGRHTVEDLADAVTRDPAALTRMTLLGLDRVDRGALTVLGALAGMHLPAELVEIVTDAGNTREALLKLQRRRLVDVEEDRFGLPACRAPGNTALLFRTINLVSAVRDIAEFVRAADPGADGTITLAKALVTQTGELARRRQWAAVVTLVEAAEPILTVAGRWSTCHRLLTLGIEGARHVGDLASEALFHHEQGTLALCSGDHALARDELTQAVGQRARLGDNRGMEVSTHNLGLIPGHAPADQDETVAHDGGGAARGAGEALGAIPLRARSVGLEPPASTAAKSRGRLKAAAGTLVAVVILGLGVVDALWDTSDGAKGSTSPSSSPTPPATGTPPTGPNIPPPTRPPRTGPAPTGNPRNQEPGVPGTTRQTGNITPTRTPPVTTPGTTGPPPPRPPVLSPAEVDFGQFHLGGRFPERVLTLRNDDDVAVRYDQPKLTGSSFRVADTDGCAGVLPPLGSCRFTVAFGPQGPGATRAELTFPVAGFPAVRSELVAAAFRELTLSVTVERGATGKVSVPSAGRECAERACPPPVRVFASSVDLAAEVCEGCTIKWVCEPRATKCSVGMPADRAVEITVDPPGID